MSAQVSGACVTVTPTTSCEPLGPANVRLHVPAATGRISNSRLFAIWTALAMDGALVNAWTVAVMSGAPFFRRETVAG